MFELFIKILIAIGIATVYGMFCLAFFYWRDWLNNKNAEYDDYQDRAG